MTDQNSNTFVSDGKPAVVYGLEQVETPLRLIEDFLRVTQITTDRPKYPNPPLEDGFDYLIFFDKFIKYNRGEYPNYIRASNVVLRGLWWTSWDHEDVSDEEGKSIIMADQLSFAKDQTSTAADNQAAHVSNRDLWKLRLDHEAKQLAASSGQVAATNAFAEQYQVWQTLHKQVERFQRADQILVKLVDVFYDDKASKQDLKDYAKLRAEPLAEYIVEQGRFNAEAKAINDNPTLYEKTDSNEDKLRKILKNDRARRALEADEVNQEEKLETKWFGYFELSNFKKQSKLNGNRKWNSDFLKKLETKLTAE